MEKNENLAENLLEFIKKSPSCFHAVKNISEILRKNGFSELLESEKWNLEKGKKYFVTRNLSSVIAFAVPNYDEKTENSPFMICASHSDSPSFKIKENPEIKSGGCVVLNVEKYGGMLIAPWLDRPLSVAGRVVAKSGRGLKQILVDIDKNLLMIPNLAIHMDRDANNGHKFDVQSEIRPVLSLDENTDLMKIVAENAKVDEKDILSADLFLYNRSEPCVWGAENEFISSSKLDDLECAFSTLQGFLDSENLDSANCDSPNLGSMKPNPADCDSNSMNCDSGKIGSENEKSENGGKSDVSSDSEKFAKSVKVYCVFDNEEVGSQTRQGAASTFLSDTLSRINFALGSDDEDLKIRLSKSFMVSADNAHALHPNFVSVADPVNRPKINGGVVIKFNAAQKYTSDSVSAGFFKSVCAQADVPFQVFTNNSNVAGGSTLGNISQTQVSVPCVDIGLAQWAMHSPYETAGKNDVDFMARAIKQFYQSEFSVI